MNGYDISMKFTIITLYPEAIRPYLDASILGRAQKERLVEIDYINLRDFGLNQYRQVDDKPYGGGPGMILRADVVIPALKSIAIKDKSKAAIIITSPGGSVYDQPLATQLSKLEHIIIICGRFEGYDARIEKYTDYVLSIGPYVLAGVEIPALTIIESISRLIPGVLGNPDSPIDESFADNSLEYPQYTRPNEYEGQAVPEVLIGGHHSEIAKWRLEQKKSSGNS
jgi:tRNA (guanine37-N1)-methyltransferase